LGGAIGSAAGGLLNMGAGNKAKNISERNQQEDREFYRKMYADALRANRANQSNPWGDLNWSQDDKGNWNQKVSLNPQDQSRLDQWRGIAAGRMGQAGKMDMSKWGQPIDYAAATKMYQPSMGGFGLVGGAGSQNPYMGMKTGD
jgi:hypothetical protein